MSNIFWKNFHLCFSRFMCLPTTLSPTSPSEKDHNPPPINPTRSTLVKNFNSLYDLASSSTSKSLTSSTDDFFSSSDDSDTDSLPDITTVFASQRFFFSSPGRSNSIIELPDSQPESDTLVAGGVAIHTFSPDPYSDFRKSMQDMVEARGVVDIKADWDFLHELLSCYLTLNPKQTHKIIVSAFADLIVSLMSSTTTNHCRKSKEQHQRTTSCPLV
ncbi:unnamed protein product [Ilex paraguariensis]|uniref:Transcription repressor n=1 Tax=Ilex paraguariensis TaxID=185542 RepID=A0ABC8SBS1_9AQUA